MKIIDPHIHLFSLKDGDYDWLKPQNPPFWPDKEKIHRDFSETDLSLATPLELAGFVHIEAGFDNAEPWREVQWLEQHCKLNFSSVAAIDITLPKTAFLAALSKILRFNSVVGCRYIFPDDAAQVLTNEQVLNNISLLASADLSFDIQLSIITTDNLYALLSLLHNNPKLNVILNHAGILADGELNDTTWSLWQSALKKLGRYENCFIKCSGWEMTDRDYNLFWLGDIVMECLHTFGNQQTLLASNFPLCLMSTTYQALWQSYTVQLPLNNNERHLLCYQNSARLYKLN